MSDLRKIGIVDDSFRLATVENLIAEGVLYRPMDGNHGEQHPKVSDYVSEGIPFIMANDISQGRINYKSCNFITQKQADGLRKGFARPGDVLVTHKATIGRTGLVGDEAEPYIMLTPQVTYYRIRSTPVLDKRFLRHYFDSSLFQQTLSMWAGAGSTRAYLGITAQRKLPIIVPPSKKQRKIAAILTAFDDLIEVNNCRIELLEKMAEEIYREWFVRMRFPGHQGTRFVKGVPEGWPFDLGSSFFDHVKGKSYASHEISDEDGTCFFITLKSFHRRGGYRKEGLKYFSGSHKEGQCVNAGDVVMAVTDMTQDRAVVGEVARIPTLSGKKAVISLDVIRLIPKKMSSTFLYAYMRHSGFASYIKEFANGANVLHLKPDLLGKQRLLFPPEYLREKFSDIVEPIYQEVNVLEEANGVLTNCRDLLLPRLISGKLSVDDLDIQFPPSMQEAGKASFEATQANI